MGEEDVLAGAACSGVLEEGQFFVWPVFIKISPFFASDLENISVSSCPSSSSSSFPDLNQ